MEVNVIARVRVWAGVGGHGLVLAGIKGRVEDQVRVEIRVELGLGKINILPIRCTPNNSP